MGKLVFSEEPPTDWNESCRNQGDLFNSTDWQELLSQGLGGKSVYGCESEKYARFAITVFHAGPFRIGYLGYPAGLTADDGIAGPDVVHAIRHASFPLKLHCIRIPVSPFRAGTCLPLPSRLAMETSIENLQEWDPEKIPKLRRVMRKCQRSPLTLVNAVEASQGSDMFRIYKRTVIRHKGNLRYTEKYFCALVSLAKKNPKIKCLLAMMSDEIAGFLVIGRHNNIDFYLHGGTEQEYRKYYPSDILFYRAITSAKEQGVNCFNMGCTPAIHTSLIRYKEKWGGRTEKQPVYDLVLNPVYAFMFRKAEAIYNSKISRTLRFL